jgi:sarcosine oxidase subunit beta
MAFTVIVGSGVLGASAAYHLARRGCRDVLVIDRAEASGRGATGHALGIFTAQHATAIEIRLSLVARDKFLSFRRDTGVDPGYRTVGCLQLAATEDELQTLRDLQRLQHAEGLIDAMELDEERLCWLNPLLDRAGVAGAVFCPTDGSVRPLDVLRGYVDAATRLGVRFEWGAEVDGIDRAADGRVRAVRTSRGSWAAERFVNAAGPWAAAVGRACGLDVPVGSVRRAVAVTVPTDVVPIGMPLTFVDGLQVSVRDGRVAITRVEALDVRTGDDDWIDVLAARARVRFPVLDSVPIDRAASWAGVAGTTPDGLPLVGRHPDCQNAFVACASPAHGVMHAPALGQVLAELVLDGESRSPGAAALAPGRFAERPTGTSA